MEDQSKQRLNDLAVVERLKEQHELKSHAAALAFKQTFDPARPLTADDSEMPRSKVELMSKLTSAGLSPDSHLFLVLWEKHSTGLPLQIK
jgi:hypothetical protein